MQKLCMRFFPALRVSSVLALAAFVLALASMPRAASADVEKRVALVIGNGDYKTAPQLENPPLDAKAVAASLKRLGFQVIIFLIVFAGLLYFTKKKVWQDVAH